MAKHSLLHVEPAAVDALGNFVHITALEQLDQLKKGDKILFNSLGILTYFGASGDALEFGSFIGKSEYIFGIIGKREEATLKDQCWLDFDSINSEVYSPRHGQQYMCRRKMLEGEQHG